MSTRGIDQFLLIDVLPAAERLGELDPFFFGQARYRAMTLAMAHLESRGRAGGVSHLAALYRNLFGIKWLPGDAERGYGRVELAPNDFEPKGQRIAYRVYQSLEHSLHNLRWHLLVSSHYRELMHPDPEQWLRLIGPVWCPSNPHHAEHLVALYRGWAGKLGLSD